MRIYIRSALSLKDSITIQDMKDNLVEGNLLYVHSNYLKVGMITMSMPYNPLGGTVLDHKEVL